ncbi:MAG: DEAD/DEAH box helicase [Chloroflexi bacterium]|nr:DEAD/DEAH box helicase [Chloroflexota bacterium]
MAFRCLGLKSALVDGVAAMGYKEPTPVQGEAIPQALAGRDIIGCAQTGTGKTAAFVLPTLQRIGHHRGIKALIVTPTRELALQIEEVAKGCARYTNHKVVAVFGGVPYPAQQKKIRDGADVLVATPGRLLDMVRRRDIRLSAVEVFVLDEADRMLDMGFLPDVKLIIRELPETRQNLLFSATMSPGVLGVISQTLDNPVWIEVGQHAVPVEAVDQAVYPVSALQKSDLLIELLTKKDLQRVLVFARTKRRADRVCRTLSRAGIRAAAIHSDRSQAQRQAALASFKAGRCRVLVATDIVARGIDVESISHVINYDIPGNPEDYVHRIGRTARASATGTAISFLAAEEAMDFRAIESFIGQTLDCRDLPGFTYEGRYVPRSDRVAARTVPKLVFDGGARRGTKRRMRRR